MCVYTLQSQPLALAWAPLWIWERRGAVSRSGCAEFNFYVGVKERGSPTFSCASGCFSSYFITSTSGHAAMQWLGSVWKAKTLLSLQKGGRKIWFSTRSGRWSSSPHGHVVSSAGLGRSQPWDQTWNLHSKSCWVRSGHAKTSTARQHVNIMAQRHIQNWS